MAFKQGTKDAQGKTYNPKESQGTMGIIQDEKTNFASKQSQNS